VLVHGVATQARATGRSVAAPALVGVRWRPVTRVELWEHQTEAVEAVEREWSRGVQRTALVLPTSGGKTITFSEIIRRWCERNPGRRAVVIAHRTELIEQAAADIRTQAQLPVGIVKAERNQTRARVVVASVQTLASRDGRRAAQIADVGLVVIDECHRSAAESYVAALKVFGAWEPAGARALGVTATLSRSDGKALGDVWQSVAYERTIADMLTTLDPKTGRPVLVRPRGIFVKVEDLDLRGVRKTGGDYRDSDLGDAIIDSLAPKRIAEAYREHADDRPGVVFLPTIAAAEAVLEALQADGRAAEIVTGKTPAGERAKIIARFRAGALQILVNVGVFTEGTNLRRISCVVIARPTLHSGLYIQMAGRGLRTCDEENKRDCLILDVVGVTRRHRLQAEIDLFGDDVMERREKELDDDDPVELPEDEPSEVIPEDLPRLDALGRLVAIEVDLFHGTAYDWQRTRKGAWFLSLDRRYLTVLPAAGGGFDVYGVPSRWHDAWTPYGNYADLNAARSAAEVQIMPGERSNAHKRTGWRRAGPSVAQVGLATALGIVTVGMTAGEVSTRIGIEQASKRIDPSLPAWMFAGVPV
jgi:superfamily II DNA or RNA helicase